LDPAMALKKKRADLYPWDKHSLSYNIAVFW
jgi:hypothetical protein